MEKTNILIVDDHPLFAQCLGSSLNCYEQFNVNAYAENGEVALKKIEISQPDIILLDLEMPVLDGEETARQVMKRYPNIKIIVISTHDEVEYVLHLLKIGVFGYVPKNCDIDTLVDAIEDVIKGKKHLPEKISQKIKDFYDEEDQIGSKALNEIEKDVIRLMAFGKRDKAVADSLDISIDTLKFHKINIRIKTGMETPAQFGAYAVKHKLVDIRDFRLK
jgi:two-component system response regulator DegU